MSYLFTSESVSEGHPDKVADQISDAILDEFLRQDKESKVACETFVSTGLVVIGGEVRSEAYVDIQSVARRVINKIGKFSTFLESLVLFLSELAILLFNSHLEKQRHVKMCHFLRN